MSDMLPEPDAFEKRVRFGCGFAFGALAAFYFSVQEIAASFGMAAAIVFFVAVVTGYLAMRFGDRFWEGFASWFRW